MKLQEKAIRLINFKDNNAQVSNLTNKAKFQNLRILYKIEI